VPDADHPDPFWAGCFWYAGSFQWWSNITYSRGTDATTGWILKFFE
jgi:hypothetical protein